MPLSTSFEIISPSTEEEFSKYYRLRYEALRKPWGMKEGSELDESDKSSVHAMLLLDGIAVAVCRLHFNTPKQAQVRYMAVAENYRGKGYGAEILTHLEMKAIQMGTNEIILQARENAVPFYKKCGYLIVSKSYLLFGEIQHYLMKKNL